MTTRPFSRCRIARRRMGSATCDMWMRFAPAAAEALEGLCRASAMIVASMPVVGPSGPSAPAGHAARCSRRRPRRRCRRRSGPSRRSRAGATTFVDAEPSPPANASPESFTSRGQREGCSPPLPCRRRGPGAGVGPDVDGPVADLQRRRRTAQRTIFPSPSFATVSFSPRKPCSGSTRSAYQAVEPALDLGDRLLGLALLAGQLLERGTGLLDEPGRSPRG